MTWHRVPEEAEGLNASEIATLLAVLETAAVNGGTTTVRAVVALDYTVDSTSSVFAHLRKLRSAGFVSWEDGRMGTLRPTVVAVWWGDPKSPQNLYAKAG